MRRYESQLRPPHGWHGQRAAPGESAVPIPAASNPTCGHRSQPLPEGGEGEGFSSHSALSPEPSALPPPRPPSTATAAKIANILLKSGSLPYALEDINHLKHPEATIFGTPVPPTSSSSWTSSPPAPSRTSSPPPRAT
jgi:hypothetical protein